jgi:ferritin
MISEKVQKALNGQINTELYSAYLYLSMSAYFQTINLTGFAGWMRTQAQEELMHAMRLYDYLNDRSGRVALARVEAPPSRWDTPLAAFVDSYNHEQQNTAAINDLCVLAAGERDHATVIHLQWFVTEQVEEEATASRIVDQLKMVGDSPQGLFLMDRELGQRGPEAAADE